jgi:hypothetical protein
MNQMTMRETKTSMKMTGEQLRANSSGIANSAPFGVPAHDTPEMIYDKKKIFPIPYRQMSVVGCRIVSSRKEN